MFDIVMTEHHGSGMAKVVEKPLKLGKARTPKAKRVRDAKTGEVIVIRTVNADSKTFASDLSRVFRSNVSAALRKRK
jgi:hypothetical protein